MISWQHGLISSRLILINRATEWLGYNDCNNDKIVRAPWETDSNFATSAQVCLMQKSTPPEKAVIRFHPALRLNLTEGMKNVYNLETILTVNFLKYIICYESACAFYSAS